MGQSCDSSVGKASHQGDSHHDVTLIGQSYNVTNFTRETRSDRYNAASAQGQSDMSSVSARRRMHDLSNLLRDSYPGMLRVVSKSTSVRERNSPEYVEIRW